MPILKVIRLTKHFGNNVSGEVCGFSADTAAHIMRNQGGEFIGDMDTTKQVIVEREVDGETKHLIIDAEPELDADGKKTGNLVEKKVEKKSEKPPAK